ncbi:oligosaccharide flippase family protein [Saliphagus sp. GCM10025334]
MGSDTDQAVRNIFKGAGLVYSGLVLEMLFAFVAQVLAARYLSVGGFGGITTGTAILNIGAIFGSVGLGRGLTRYLPRQNDVDRRSSAQVALFITAPVSIILGLLVAFNAEVIATQIFGDPTVIVSVQIFGATIPFAALLTVGIGGIRGQQRAREHVYIENILRPTLRFGLIIAAVLYGLGQAAFASAYAIPYAIGAVVALYYFLTAVPGSLSTFIINRGQAEELLRFSLPFTITSATSFIYRSSDIFLVLYFLNSTAVGIYGVAYAAAQLVSIVSTAFNYLGEPVASKVESNSGLTDMFRVHQSILRWSLIASVPIIVPFVFFPVEFISTVYRAEYASGASTLLILTIGFGIHNVLSTKANILSALGKSTELAVNNTLAAVTNIGLNILLIPSWGIVGAAVATVVAYLLRDLMMILEVWYHTGQTGFSRATITPGLIALPLFGIAALISPIIPKTVPWIIAFTALFSVSYLVAVVVGSGLTAEDVMLIRSLQEQYGLESQRLDAVLDQYSRD